MLLQKIDMVFSKMKHLAYRNVIWGQGVKVKVTKKMHVQSTLPDKLHSKLMVDDAVSVYSHNETFILSLTSEVTFAEMVECSNHRLA